MPRIHVDGLVKSFGEQRALDRVTFEVEDGELFTLLGPSGCGKSTTLMSLAGFQQPEQGRIAVGEETFFDAARGVGVAAEQRNLGIVFQSYAVWPHMTVFENLAFPLRVRRIGGREIRARVLEVLELVEMAAYETRYPHQLSGGQQQRVALGRALVYAPSVLLLDEPFSNLDAKLRERARAWVKELQQTLGLTTVFVTHDQDEALSMSDRVVVISAGQVQQIGTPEEVYRQPANRFVAEFVGRVNLIEGTVVSAAGSRALLDVEGAHRLELDRAGVSGRVVLAVRPEAITLLEAGERPANGATTANTWEAAVSSVAFLGDHYEYELRAGPLALTAVSPRRVPGERVRLHIPPDACAVVA